MVETATVRTVAELRQAVRNFRERGETIGLVPTMGALHDGHIALVEAARKHADRVITTIFVNPSQFAPTEDLSKYPRTEDADLRRLKAAHCDILFAPAVGEIYPDGFATTITLAGPATAELEDRFRPTHFAGVATIVAKLFIQSGADVALFGEKDYQQLTVIRRMARDLDLPIDVIGLETIRENDGLAMSSRNRFLSASERALAPLLHQVLRQVASALDLGEALAPVLADAWRELEAAGFVLDYLEARNAGTLAPIRDLTTEPVRLLAAARLGRTRLIDNIAVA